MKKRIIALLLSLMLAASVIPAAAAETADDTAQDAAVVEETAEENAEETAEPVESEPVEKAELAETGDPEVSYPVITNVVPAQNGATVSWTNTGAVKYMVFIRRPDNSGWKKIGESVTTSFLHKFTPDNTEYVYTVRAADQNNQLVGGYDKAGYAFACLPTPVLTAVQSVAAGQRVCWNAVDGADCYRVYVSTDSGWKAVADTAVNAYVNPNAVSGQKYSYTVRCWSRERRAPLSFYNRRGISGVYVETPVITGFAPVKGGTRISWNYPAGAKRCSVFMWTGAKWKKLANTTAAYYDHVGLTGSTEYTYTVRCIDNSGSFISPAAEQASCRYLTPPELISVVNGKLTWKETPYTAHYRVYRREFGKSWVAIANSDATTYTDTPAAKTLYNYTVRSLDENYRLISHFTCNDVYYYNGNPANGKITVGGSTLNFENGKLRQGYVTIDGKMYYFDANGVMQKNGLVGSSREGWRYADANGVVQLNYTGLASNSAGTWYVTNGLLDRTLRDAVTVGGVDYVVINGRAIKTNTEELKTLFLAMKLANRVADRSLSKSQRLRILFDYITGDVYTEMNPRLPDYTGMDWPIIYANDLLLNDEGNCMSYAALFGFLAKAIGYDNIYACYGGTVLAGHSWAEINGLVYDPEWSMHSFDYNYYGMSYDEKSDRDYTGALAQGYEWLRIEICPNI